MAKSLWGFVAASCLWPAVVMAAQAPVGLWSTPDHGGVVQIKPCGADLCGYIVGVTPAPNGAFPRDVTGVPQCQLMLLKDLAPKDDGRWHGTVRNPEDGQVYSAEVWLGEDGNMRLRGYLGLELFGSTQTWMKFAGGVNADCRFQARPVG